MLHNFFNPPIVRVNMIRKIIPIIIVIGFSVQKLFAQPDTLINYNVLTKEIKLYPKTTIDSTITSNFTQWYYGTDPGREILDTDPPANTYNNSGFTDLIPAKDLFSINNYPIRTAVKIYYMERDTLKQRCSGILVARNLVLTDCHCVGVFDSTRSLVFYDSLYVFPAFDNGVENEFYRSSRGIEFITFSSNLKNFWYKDIALIKLEENIGEKAGWVGIAFQQDDSVLWNSVFHKLSYPAATSINDTTKVYNGDTLYYSYGTLDVIDSLIGGISWLGYNISGIPGQSGSSLIFSDNEKYYTLGTQVWSSNSRHIRITPEIFYSFKTIIEDEITGAVPEDRNVADFRMSEAYPNPFNSSTNIRYILPRTEFVTLKVYDILGSELEVLLSQIQSSGIYNIQFNASNLSSGVYFIRIQAGSFSSTKKIILLK